MARGAGPDGPGSDGSVLIAGGDDGATILNSAELYEP
jgi:hypothetical protein